MIMIPMVILKTMMIERGRSTERNRTEAVAWQTPAYTREGSQSWSE